MLNKVFLIGRLTREPEVRFLPSGMKVVSFAIAVNRRFKDRNGNWKEESYFFDVETYGSIAERIGAQFNKGYQILIEGSLRQDKWESSSGERRSKVKIVADKVSLISKPSGATEKLDTSEGDYEIPSNDFESDEEIPF